MSIIHNTDKKYIENIVKYYYNFFRCLNYKLKIIYYNLLFNNLF